VTVTADDRHETDALLDKLESKLSSLSVPLGLAGPVLMAFNALKAHLQAIEIDDGRD
jgi:hypothetical protein